MRIFKNLLIGLIILWGLLALTLRVATPFISDYREQIAAQMADRLGVPVSIGTVSARWYGLRPLLELHQVRIGSPAGEMLQVEQISLDLAGASLLRGALVEALRVTIEGMQLTMVREPTGQIHVEGYGAVLAGSTGRTGPVPMPSHIRLVNTRVVWIDRKAGKAPLPIDNVAVVLDRDGGLLKLRARLESGSGRADLSARLDGLLTTTAWRGDTYLRVSSLDVADLFAHYLPPSYGLRSLTLDLESWSRWQDAAPVHTQGDFRLRDLDLQPTVQDSSPLQIAQASARFSFARDRAGLRVGLKDLQLGFADHRWPQGDLAFTLSPQADGGSRIRAAADYLRIDDVVQILQVRLPWSDLREPFEQLQPRGEVRRLRLQVDIAADHFDWRAEAGFNAISLAPSGKIPGVENLSGQIRGQQDHLVLQLDSRAAQVRFRELFRDPLELDTLRGRLDLVSVDGGWQLRGDGLVADSPHISTRSRVQMLHVPGQPLMLDLQTDFRDGDAAFASRYYPTGVMSAKLVDWLDQAIKGGRVPGGSLLIHGPLNDFPFEAASNGVFQVVFDTAGIELDYRTGWPRLEQVAARLKFHGNRLDITLDDARVYDSHVTGATAGIQSLHPLTPLRVRGRVVGPLTDNLRVLQEAALRDRFGGIAGALSGAGETELELDISLPLGSPAEPALAGALRLADARLSLPEWRVDLRAIDGTVSFDLDGVSAEGIQARMLGAPVVVDILRLADRTTRVRTRGRLGIDAIRAQLPDIPLPLISGASDFTVSVDVPAAHAPGGNPIGLLVESDLQGIRVELPAPFGKRAAEQRTFALYLPLGGRPTAGSLDYGGEVSARFGGGGRQVDVVLGGDEARLLPDDGIRIGGHLQRLDLAAWKAVLDQLPAMAGDERPPLSVDLRLDRLLADSVSIEGLHLKATRTEGMWRGSVDAKNLAGGFAAAERPGETPVKVDLQRLNLKIPFGSDDVAIPPRPDPATGPDPAGLPGLELSIAELRVNEARLGELRLDAQPSDEGLRVTRLSLRGGQIELDSAGHWSHEPTGFRTQLGGRVSTVDLGTLLVDLGYTRQVEKAGGSAEFLLGWPGSPAQFHRATVRGRVGLDVAAGRLLELDPGVTRVVGLLNLNALTRRLRLDFSDFYKKGYSFDSIRGDLEFARGSARTEDLSVLGPTGRIDVKGSADILARTLDQRVTVTPNLDATLPLAGTLAGGPVAGLAVLVAQKVMSKQVDAINRFEYSLSGPWNEPEVKQLDSGGTLSKLLQPFSGDAAGVTAAPDGPGVVPAADEPSLEEAAGASADVTPPAETAAQPASDPAFGHAPAQDPVPQPVAEDGGGPLQGLIDFLKSGQPYGVDLPGEGN